MSLLISEQDIEDDPVPETPLLEKNAEFHRSLSRRGSAKPSLDRQGSVRSRTESVWSDKDEVKQ